MANKQYQVVLDNTKIGVTELEKADAPMGVVFGKLTFDDLTYGYDFLKNHCMENNVETTDYPEDKLISTRNIPKIRVIDSWGTEIRGLACSISGMDSDQFEITIEGVPYPFYEEEFPHHVRAYNKQFNRGN
jgi:hypothetical protein